MDAGQRMARALPRAIATSPLEHSADGDIGLQGKADGRARRFALLGYADNSQTASSVYHTLAANLDGKEIESGYRLH